jgi:hypothetical protein
MIYTGSHASQRGKQHCNGTLVFIGPSPQEIFST